LHVQPGSGGYGNPFEREPARVLADVRDEKLSLERARSAYGVVLSDDARSVDEQATAAWRAAHAKAD
jgi:N-methylhydantoinase B